MHQAGHGAGHFDGGQLLCAPDDVAPRACNYNCVPFIYFAGGGGGGGLSEYNIPRVRSRAEVEAERKRLCSRQMLQGTFYDLLPASLKASWRAWHLCFSHVTELCRPDFSFGFVFALCGKFRLDEAS